jgi:hypothetical protein
VSRAVKPQGYRILIEIVGQESHPSVFTNLVRGREVAGLIVILYNPNADDLQALHDLTAQGSAVLALQHMSDQLYTVTSNHLGGYGKGLNTSYIYDTGTSPASAQRILPPVPILALALRSFGKRCLNISCQ